LFNWLKKKLVLKVTLFLSPSLTLQSQFHPQFECNQNFYIFQIKFPINSQVLQCFILTILDLLNNMNSHGSVNIRQIQNWGKCNSYENQIKWNIQFGPLFVFSLWIFFILILEIIHSASIPWLICDLDFGWKHGVLYQNGCHTLFFQEIKCKIMLHDNWIE
jgi:hypothetical protein